jgi:hypothetical protein
LAGQQKRRKFRQFAPAAGSRPEQELPAGLDRCAVISAQTFLKSLVDTVRSLDGSRLISAAMEVHGDKQNPD